MTALAPGHIHFLLGGARSGKSCRAETLAAETSRDGSSRVLYVATCATLAPLDGEMAARLDAHRNRRPAEWTTLENRFDLEAIFAERAGWVVLLDCLTLWLSWHAGLGWSESAILETLDRALSAAQTSGVHLYVVSNELGMGLVPLGTENRAYRDLVGKANCRVAQKASVVEFVAAGLPIRLK